ncbi:EAL domain-containing protein [Desulfosporosinus sp. Sb-LF]|uniref:EAL domain-containing protein n=1 Tax=Desulfosporosinus sp. Sb-LF TaxID=2560027 RepID=UPI00107F3FDE|nr:EAL domain-containing protein [Desulfosporosinus sp. Sb-LF]TGE33531.1 EAL domain-containing protein [Desulfosporosinus sp. Sb-LF]
MDFELNYSHAFAYRKIIVDEGGLPIDYEFVEVNKAFENLTGLKRDFVIGKKINDILPNYATDKFDWIGVYGNVALTGISTSFEQYSEAFGRWYRVEAASNEHGFFATIFSDISSLKQKEQESLAKNEQLGQLYEEISATEEELRQQMVELNQSTQLLKESERRLNRAQALAHVGNWEIDLATKTVWASEETFNLYGLNRETPFLSLESIQKVVHTEDRAQLDQALERLINETAEYNVNFRIIKANTSEERYMHSVAELEYGHSRRPVRILGVIQDVTASVLSELDLKRKNRVLRNLYEELTGTEEELRQQFDEIITNKAIIELSEERYKTLVNNSPDVIYSCDCDGVFTTINKEFSEVIGLPEKEIIGKTINEIQRDSAYIEEWHNQFSKVINKGKVNSFIYKYERKIGSGIGYYNVTLSPIFDSSREIIGVIGTNHDITTLKENERVIKHMAYYDFLTDLPNRVLFLDRLKSAIALSEKNATKVYVVFLDLDDFKRANDTLGHVTGDGVLIETTKKLLKCISKKDILARLGGDEFALLLDDAKQQECIVSLLETIKSSFQESFRVNDHIINLTASMGISRYPDDGETADELIKNADTAMYKAKEVGKNGYQFFNLKMKEDLLLKTNIERLLRNAIINNDFVLHYQPQYTAQTGELRGFEALIRWNCPEMGFLNPMEFIPIAEETGLIIQIGEWVINTASRICKELEIKYGCDLVMAINISPIQLRQKDFSETVMQALELSGLKPTSLELEVTENIFIDSFDCVVNKLRNLKKLGVRIALDDFGTGYSSLNYLRKLPITLLKIDKAFVKEIDSLDQHNGLTGSIIALASKLNIKTIAEGVETLEQLDYLSRANCDYLQGFLLEKPVPKDLLGSIIEKGSLREFLL